ncbi:MAG: hypothetical protein IBJ11_00445 [Phycisphaerales bacterium]|nr:hypothetical protein [Phycisphaerales bacterium]
MAAGENIVLPAIAIGGGLLVAIVAIVFSAVSAMVRSSNRERTRREIAAYVAEGTMTPEEGERLLKAGAEEGRSCGWGKPTA